MSQKVVLGKGIGALFKEASTIMNQPHNMNAVMGGELKTPAQNNFQVEGTPFLVAV